MIKPTGDILRLVGLLIEMVGVWGVYRSSVDGAQAPGQQAAGGAEFWWITVAVGFVIWLAGRLVISSENRSRRKALWQDQRKLTP